MPLASKKINLKLCALCEANRVYDIRSHFTPSAITKFTFGERGSEEIYTIDAEAKKTDVYYGPGHPQKESFDVKQAPNVLKGVFCKKCEAELARIESKCQTKINSIVAGLGKGGYRIERSNQGVKYLKIEIEPNMLALFFYTIVWRQVLEQKLKGKDLVLEQAEFDNLRKIVLDNIVKSDGQIENTDFGQYPKISIFTTYNTDLKTTPSYVNPNTYITNPEIFFIGPINLLFLKDGPVTEEFEKKVGVGLDIFEDELKLNGSDSSKLVLINEKGWRKVAEKLAGREGRKFNR